MKLVRWEFNGLHVPMMEDDNKNLFCTTKQLADALQTDEIHIRKIKDRHSTEFEEIRETICLAKNFLSDHRVEFGIKRMRSDMILWGESHMILAAILIKSAVGKEFRRNLVQFVKANARKGYVHESVLDAKVAPLEAALEEIRAFLNMGASAAGKNLALQKQNKHLRMIQ